MPGTDGLPSGAEDFRRDRPVGYQLIALDSPGIGNGVIGDRRNRLQGFWHLQNHICETCAFASYGTLRGDTYGEDKANAPWGWDDKDDGESFAGDFVCDPAHLFDLQLNSLGAFSHVYVDHLFWTHKTQNMQIMPKKDFDSDPYAADTFYLVTAPGIPFTPRVIDERVWKKNDVALNAWSPQLIYGADQAEGQTEYGDIVSTHYFCRQTKSHTFDREPRSESFGAITDSYNAGPNVDVLAYDDDGSVGFLLFAASASSGSRHGACGADDDSISPIGQPNDLLPLITLYDFTCDSPGVSSSADARVSFRLSRVKRPDVATSSSCIRDTGNSCGTYAADGDCSCEAVCRSAGTCCADKISICGP